MNVKHSISFVLTGICLLGMLAVAVTVSAIFVVRMRSVTMDSIKTGIEDKTTNITSSLIQSFSAYERALFHTAAGIALIFDHSDEPLLNENVVAEDEMRMFLSRINSSMENVSQVFMTNNIPTFQAGGFGVFAPLWRIPDNYDQTTRPWFIGAKRNPGAVSYTDPYMALATGVFSISLSTVIFDRQRNDLGVLTMDIAVSSLTNMVEQTNNLYGMEVWLLNRDGIYISNRDESKVMRVNFFEDQGLERYRQSVLNARTFYIMDSDYIIYSAAIPGADWVVISVIPASLAFADVNRMVFATIILVIVLISIILVVIVLVIRRISKPITTIADALRDISQGEGDLTRQITVKANNEVGDLALYFNMTLEKIRKLIIIIKQQSVTLSDNGNDLAANMNRTSSEVGDIASNIKDIKSRVINQSSSVTETNATMEQITVSINQLNKQVELQSNSIAQSSAAIEEMLANINSVTQTLSKNAENVKALSLASEVGRKGLNEVSEDIKGIAKESDGLMEINSVIENIASQTNLLSMNAAIEAAHAGELGKGFAVVAGEIRKLAENASKQSKTISTVLNKMKVSIDKITKSTDNVLNKFEAIDKNIRVVFEQEENIRDAMSEQGEGSKQILEAIGHVNDVTRRVKNESQGMLDGSKEVIKESHNLEVVTQHISGSMNDMSDGAEKVLAAVQEVNELSDRNREYIDILVKEVSKFKS